MSECICYIEKVVECAFKPLPSGSLLCLMGNNAMSPDITLGMCQEIEQQDVTGFRCKAFPAHPTTF